MFRKYFAEDQSERLIMLTTEIIEVAWNLSRNLENMMIIIKIEIRMHVRKITFLYSIDNIMFRLFIL